MPASTDIPEDETLARSRDPVRVVGLGQACVDYLGTLEAYPEEDGKAELKKVSVGCGGPASTALVTLSRLSVPTAFLGSVSDDSRGLKIVDNLRAFGIDISGLKVTPGFTSQLAFIAVTRGSGKRTVFWQPGTAPHLEAREIDLGLFPEASILHVDSLMVQAASEAARQARSLGMYVVMDAGTMRKGTFELMPMVDTLIASETFPEPLVGPDVPVETALREIRKLGPSQVIITLGERGSIGLDRDGFRRQEAFQVGALDTTGAGDVYHGAYIYGLLQGWRMSECMRFASATAAINCMHLGAQAGIPDLDAVSRLLGPCETR